MASQPAIQDVRVLDFLDDKLQSLADLDALDSLIENVKTQQHLLKQQLSDARQVQHTATEAAHQHAVSLQQKTDAFDSDQASIDARIRELSDSGSPDDAVRQYQSGLDRLWKLDAATKYAELLDTVETLSSSCAAQLDANDERVLESYGQLQSLTASLGPLQTAADGAAPHLVDHVARTTAAVRDKIQQSFSAEFEKTVQKMGWPKQGITLPEELRAEWNATAGRLLDLQKTEIATGSSAAAEPAAVLLPLQIMAKPLEQRFAYHFSGDRPTNRLDKPEYFLNHVRDLLEEYAGFFQVNMQSLLTRRFRETPCASIPAYIDATSALITALLPMLRRKLKTILPRVTPQPQLFSNLIHEVMAFDVAMQNEWSYTPQSTDTLWRGLSHYILDDESYFGQWLAVERDFALARYDEIISDRSTGELEYDATGTDSTKPSKAAIRVNDLIDTITDRYRDLSSFSQKLRFLVDIQIAILDRFHRQLSDSLEAYLTRTSAVARTVHGVSREDQAELAGTKGLDRLCRVYGSAEYLERSMRDWSDDVFFLTLWEELQYRSAANVPIKGELRISEILSRTSSTIIEGEEPEKGPLQGGLFDETAASYQALRGRAEEIICDALGANLRGVLRAYTSINPWCSLAPSSSATTTASIADDATAATTAELDPPLRVLDEHLSFLSRALAPTPMRRIARVAAQEVQTVLWNKLLARHTFSASGAAQFAVDVAALCGVVDRHARIVGAGEAGMARLTQGLKLLTLPVRVDRHGEGESTEQGQDGEEGKAQKKWGLFDVERRVYVDNESARDVLEEMGLDALSESDARTVLERRVELSS